MEADKENFNDLKAVTRIPLPLAPLPALPKSLLIKKTISEKNQVRQPLETLFTSNVNEPCSSSTQIKKIINKRQSKRVIELDTRYVTLRSKNPQNERLDWDYNVFNDHNENIISISDEDSDEKDLKEVNYFPKNKDKNGFGECRLAVTPAVQSVEHKGIRNIKRSLKRPHSRELQGLSPVENQDGRVDPNVKRRLHFSEGLQDQPESLNLCDQAYMTCLTRDYSDDLFEYLLSVEKKPLSIPNISSITRACVINWLIKINGPRGNPAIVQSACWYLDSILGTSQVRLAKLQLVAAACYWIARKLHGPPILAGRLITCSNFAFNAETLLTTEKRVLMRLKFPVQPVVPHEFITYLAWWCDNANPFEIEAAASFLCICGLLVDKASTEEFPSVIAAAAVRNALLLLGQNELIAKLKNCPVYKEAEKKTSRMSFVVSVLRRAVRTVAAPLYQYKAPMEQYSAPPHCIAQRVITAASELAVMDDKHARRKESVSFKL